MKNEVKSQVIAALRAGPATKAEMCEKFNLGRLSVNTVLHRLRHAGDVHIATWRTDVCPASAVFQWGAGEDAPRPGFSEPKPATKRRKETQATAKLRAAIVALLREYRHSTVKELTAETGGQQRAVYRVVQDLRSEGKAHISGFECCATRSGAPSAIVTWGRGADVKREPMSRAEITKRYRERHVAIVRAKRRAAVGAAPIIPVWLQGLMP